MKNPSDDTQTQVTKDQNKKATPKASISYQQSSIQQNECPSPVLTRMNSKDQQDKEAKLGASSPQISTQSPATSTQASSTGNASKETSGIKAYVPKFSEKWVTKGTNDFRPLIEKSSKGTAHFFCVVCQKDYKVSYLYGTNNHFKTQTHLENEKNYKGVVHHDDQESTESLKIKMVCLYFNFITFLAEKNLPISIADDMTEFLKMNEENLRALKHISIY